MQCYSASGLTHTYILTKEVLVREGLFFWRVASEVVPSDDHCCGTFTFLKIVRVFTL